MALKNIAVFGIYHSANEAERAVDHLLNAGFSDSDISVLLPDESSTRDFAHEKNTKAPEGATTGVTAGGLVGGTLGLLAGIGSAERSAGSSVRWSGWASRSTRRSAMKGA